MAADTSSASVPGNPGGEFPRAFYAIIRAIDRFTDVTGRLIALTMLFLMVTISYEVVMRYGFNAPTVWVYESSFMANGSAFMLGAAYALLKGAHVRTDIYWENYSERKKGVVDLISYLLFFYPAMITFMLISIDDALHSYDTGERSQESVWRAIMWPFRATIPLAALLLMIQGISEVLKCWYQVQFGREFVHREKIEI
ncbi:TRAP-type mannitol/chloroaromatic compound transport system permease small subunit [Bradyrhizobium sp. AZCC 1588]|uniref:TRAP transporter small permease subunit n=1 Tax=unclassified Bradyrhizobium TaxID=2631580 RepID=UPI0023AFF079|nr:TRAP transporter small permease subunit [Bradyrhizobium sp. CSA112]MDE5452190.1 TRAP transporter small permease subunit [Bradyrhizobium sp. CSA112]